MESSCSEEFDRNIFMVDSNELATHLKTVQKMYIMGESRENVFKYFLKSMVTLMSCNYGFVAELINIPSRETSTNIFRTLSIINNKNENPIDNCDIPESHPLFENIIDNKPYILKRNEIKMNNLFGWKKIRGICIVPFFEKEMLTGVIVLASNKYCLWESEQELSRILPVKYICASLLKGFRNQSLKDIYENIVNYVSLPLLVFSRDNVNMWVNKDGSCDNVAKKSFSSMQISYQDLSNFNCIVCNDAFKQLNTYDVNNKITYDDKLMGKFFYDCFPNMIDNSQIQTRWIDMWKTGVKTEIDAIKYYDKYVSENLYSIEFNKLDQKTFMMIIYPVSEQLKTKELIQDIAKSQEEFIAKVSHELRTPVHAILSIVSLLYDSPIANQTGEVADDFRKKLQMMSESSVSLCSLIQDILDYTQLESKSLNISYKTFDLSECIDGAMSMISNDSRRNGISLLKSISNDVPLCILSDPKRLKQIIVNLLSNAVKFTKDGSISVNVSMKNSRLTNNLCIIKFEIKDTGIGISNKDVTKLFKPFSQIGRNVANGTGLGLVIAKHLANLLGGEIYIESSVGRGTTVIFTIKARICSLKSIQEYYGPILKGKNVLVIDDNFNSRNKIVTYLIDQEIKAVSAENENIGIRYLNSKIYNFDLIISDNKFEEIKKYCKNIISIINSDYIEDDSSDENSDENDFNFLNKSQNDASGRIGITSSKNSDDLKTSDIEYSYIHRPINKDQLLHLCYSRFAKLNNNSEVFKFSTKKQPKHHKKDLRILIVEDDYINMEVLKEILNKLSYTNIMQAGNGEEALKVSKNNLFDVILLDLKMPIMNGYKFFELLKESHKKTIEKMPYVIALTASAMNSDKQRCLDKGMDRYLAKPVDISALNDILEEL
jgi:signal transduction histidine kinase/CheY-like chemotaxis protein